MSNNQLFTTQSAFKLRLDTGVDLVANPTLFRAIYWKRPVGTTGSWPGTVTSGSPRLIEYDGVTASDLPAGTGGPWRFWSAVKFTDGREAYGQPVTLRIKEPGE